MIRAVLLFCIPLMVEAASFDCSKSSSGVERMICSDATLSQLDDTLAAVYKTALEATKTPRSLRESQRAWLARRNACDTASCLRLAYESRTKELSSVLLAEDNNASGLISEPDPRENAQGENIAPVGKYISVTERGSPTQEFYLELWSYKDSLVGVFSYDDITRSRVSRGYDWRDASGGLLESVSYDARSGKLSFRTTLTKACVRKKSSPCSSPYATVLFRGVLKNGPPEDVIRGTLEIRDRTTREELFQETVVFEDPGSGNYTRFESYDKWHAFMKGLMRNRGGNLE